MKLTASLLPGINRTASLAYPARLMQTVSPGQIIHTASGHQYRVVQKTASIDGTYLHLAAIGAPVVTRVNLRQLANMYPMSPAVIRLTAAIRRIALYDKSLNLYVRSAIEEAGLPVDREMDWGKFLPRVFVPALRSMTEDYSLIEDVILDIVSRELVDRAVLERFDAGNASLEGKDLAKKVSAFLTYIFKQKVPDAVEILRKQQGVGTKGKPGNVPVESLHGLDEEQVRQFADTTSSPTEDDMLGNIDIQRLFAAFTQFITKKVREHTALALNFITSEIAQGTPREDLRAAMIASGLTARSGEPYNVESFKKLMQVWMQLLKAFVDSPYNPYTNTAIVQALSKNLQKTQKPVRASLKLALEDSGVDQTTPYATTTAPTVVVEPAAPINPNVQQQNQLKNQQQNVAPQQTHGQEPDYQQPTQNVDPNMPIPPVPPVPPVPGTPQTPVPPKRTIPPEIPGMNHMTSSLNLNLAAGEVI